MPKRWRVCAMPNAGSSSGHDGAAMPTERHRRRYEMPRRLGRRCGFASLIAAGLFVAAVIVTMRWGNRALWPPHPGAPTTEIFIVSHGYHAGIVVPRRAVAEQASRRGRGA